MCAASPGITCGAVEVCVLGLLVAAVTAWGWLVAGTLGALPMDAPTWTASVEAADAALPSLGEAPEEVPLDEDESEGGDPTDDAEGGGPVDGRGWPPSEPWAAAGRRGHDLDLPANATRAQGGIPVWGVGRWALGPPRAVTQA